MNARRPEPSDHSSPTSASSDRRRPWRTFAWVVAVLGGLVVVAVSPQQWAAYQVGRARRLMTERDYPGALRLLTATAKYQPRHAALQFCLGRVHRHLDDMNAAGEHLTLAGQYGYPAPLVEREFQLISAQQGHLESIEPFIGSLLAVEIPELPDIYEALSRGFVLELRFRDANRMLDSWTQLTDRDPLLHILRGDLLTLKEDWKQTIDSYRAALRWAQENDTALLGLGEALIAVEDWQNAEDAFRKALPVTTDKVRAERGLARSLLELGRIDEARELLNRAGKTLSANDGRRPLLARLALLEQKPQEALDWLAPLSELWPEDIEMATLEAAALRALERVDEAARRQQVADAGWKEVGQLAAMRGLLDTQVKNADLRFEIGVLVVRRLSRSQGVRWLYAATLLNSFHREAHENLVATCEKAGDLAAARRHRLRMETIVDVAHR